MDLGWISNILVVVLLAATLVFVARLHRRLESLRAGRQEFEGLIERFSQSVQQAEQKMGAIKLATAESGTALQERIDAAAALKDDLAFLAEKAGRLADKLEGSIARARPTLAKTSAAPAQPERGPRAVEAAPAETLPEGPGRELLRALASVR